MAQRSCRSARHGSPHRPGRASEQGRLQENPSRAFGQREGPNKSACASTSRCCARLSIGVTLAGDLSGRCPGGSFVAPVTPRSSPISGDIRLPSRSRLPARWMRMLGRTAALAAIQMKLAAQKFVTIVEPRGSPPSKSLDNLSQISALPKVTLLTSTVHQVLRACALS
jgi:hypothetical protein